MNPKKILLSVLKKPILFLVVLLAVIFLAFLPLRNQAFRDDFAYIWNVKHYLETGSFKISEWSSAPGIAPTVWGITWSKALGHSIKTLHFSNYLVLTIGILFNFLLLRRLGFSDQRSFVFTLVLLTNPWMLNFTMSYMTDIQAMSWTIASLYFITRGFRDWSWKSMLVGGIFAGISFLTRQQAISIAVGLIVVTIYSIVSRKRRVTFPLLLGMTVLLAIIGGYFWWERVGDHKTLARYYYIDRLVIERIYGRLFLFAGKGVWEAVKTWGLIFHRLVFYLSQVIVFTLPVWLVSLPGIFRRVFRRVGRVRLWWISILALGVAYGVDVWFFREGYSAGYPLAAFEQVPIWPWFWPHLWKYFLGVGILFWATIPVLLTRSAKKLTPLRVFLIVTTVGYAWLTSTTWANWPQYAIQLYPLALIFLAWVTRGIRFSPKLAAGILTVTLAYSVWLTRFRYQLTGDVWRVCEDLMAPGLTASEIECHGQYSHRWWHEFETGVAEKVKEIGREQFIKTNDGSWSDRGTKRKVGVKVIYDDSLLKHKPEIVVSWLD